MVGALVLGTSGVIPWRFESSPRYHSRKLHIMPSERFVQLNIPCNECLVSPACKDKKEIDKIKDKYELYQFMLGLRRWDESKKCYTKGLIEAWINEGANIIQNLQPGQYNHLPKHAVPEYLNSLIELANSLQWMINSQSWKDGKMHKLDKEKFKEKLQQAIAWI